MYVKRDDETDSEMFGNKVRNLEVIIFDPVYKSYRMTEWLLEIFAGSLWVYQAFLNIYVVGELIRLQAFETA